MSNQKLILLNGPSRSGKDTAARFLASVIPNSIRIGFADHLKNATHAAYGLGSIAFDAYEQCKDVPSDDFLGLTPRHAYIAHSEMYMKKLHGKHVFGTFYTRAAIRAGAEIMFASDSGFVDEAENQIERVGRENVLLLRIYRNGHNFSHDSRSYIELPNVYTIDIENNTTVEDYLGTCLVCVGTWVALKGG